MEGAEHDDCIEVDWNSLPDIVWLEIFSNINPFSLLRVRTVCRRWRTLAMHPTPWLRTNMKISGRSSMLATMLRIAPCLKVLDLGYIDRSLKPHQGIRDLARTTDCALEELSIVMDDEHRGESLTVLKNQLRLGRLRKLRLDFTYTDREDVQEFLKVIDIGGFSKLQISNVTLEHLPSWTFSPSCAGYSRLRKLVYCYCSQQDSEEPLLASLVQAHAATLEVVHLCGASMSQEVSRWLGQCCRLRSLNVPGSAALANLRPLKRMPSFTALELSFSKLTLSEPESQTFYGFFGEASVQLQRLCMARTSQSQTEHYAEEAAMLTRCLSALAVGASSALEELDLTEWEPPAYVTLLTSLDLSELAPINGLVPLLPNLPRLRVLVLRSMPAPDLLDAIPASALPSLRELTVFCYMCSDTVCSVPALRRLLSRNPYCHFTGYEMGIVRDDTAASACLKNGHPVYGNDKPRFGSLFYGHEETDSCALHKVVSGFFPRQEWHRLM